MKSIASKHALILNRLHEMQSVLAFAYCKEELQLAESTIVSQETLIASMEKRNKELEQLVRDYEEVNVDKKRLVRELDILLNGDGAAQQASLVDIVSQVANGGLPMQKDARRWNAFINCARIRIFGWAGADMEGKVKPDKDNYVHFGADFWTKHHPSAVTDPIAKTLITTFADAAIEAQLAAEVKS